MYLGARSARSARKTAQGRKWAGYIIAPVAVHHSPFTAPLLARLTACSGRSYARLDDQREGVAMKAEVISIGTEILLGEILDTNAQFIASRLPALGIDLYWMSKVGDNRGRLLDLLKQAWDRSELIICTGGLGPTEDDVTREAIADTLGEEPYVDAEQEDHLRRWFAARTAAMPERNLKQAWLTPSTRAIPNPRGTAPGWWAEKDGRIILAMPGPPAEMTRMWEKEVEPQLRGRSSNAVIVSRTIKTVGIGEGNVDEMISPLLQNPNPSIGVYSRMDGIHVRVTAKAPTPRQAEALIEPVEHELRTILGSAVWGVDDESFESAVGKILKERGLTLATMESATGGLLGSTLTDAPGSSSYFRGGIISYATEIKEQFGVPRDVMEQFGVISPECARAMASAVREALHADLGVGVTGVAGPEEQEGKPIGTMHVAVADGDGEPAVISYQFAQGREAAKRRAVTNALLLIRRTVLARP
jgi:nicotinamide-nucleotide amidase